MLKTILAVLNSRTGTLRLLFFAVLGVCAAADFRVPRPEIHFFGDKYPMFWTVFGLGSCLAMALLCKGLSKHVTGRSEDYYDG